MQSCIAFSTASSFGMSTVHQHWRGTRRSTCLGSGTFIFLDRVPSMQNLQFSSPHAQDYLCFEVVNHFFNAKGGVGKQANVVCHPTIPGSNEVRQAEIGRVILLSLLSQAMEPVCKQAESVQNVEDGIILE